MNHGFFHHDNAPAHSVLRTRQFLTKHLITVLPHPTYSPDLALSDFFCSQNLRNSSKEEDLRRFRRLRKNATKKLKAITKEAY